MIQRIRTPQDGSSMSFYVQYDCPCGEGRAVMGKGVRSDRSLSPLWRDTGPCKSCGAHQTWRLINAGEALVIQVEVVNEA